jgi:hypothetical protein
MAVRRAIAPAGITSPLPLQLEESEFLFGMKPRTFPRVIDRKRDFEFARLAKLFVCFLDEVDVDSPEYNGKK